MSGLEGLLAGRVLGGRYLVEEVIGRGGMGAVYGAVDERLGRRVAVKVITLAGDDAEARERLRARFHREARAAAALPHHPNVVPVYDYGTDEALGLDYIVMELLRGSDLATRLARSGPPPLAAALRILVQAARGVAVGHRSGLIHRDVKPGNIFLAESDHNEIQVRVVDFGIAKLADDEDTASQLTQDGRAPHSPAFASPEQLRGLGRLTPASDVFSLGAVGFLLLTGERPFSEADRNRMSLGMPVAVPSLRARNPAIPAAVDEVIQQALAFDPESRFPSAAAMLIALERVLREMPDTPIEPYSTDAVLPHAADEDHTQLMDEGGDDEHTLLAPPPGAAASPPRPAPPAPRRREEPRRSRAPLVVWSLVLLALAAVGVWAWMESNRPARVVEVTPVEPDTPVVVEDAVLEAEAPPTAVDAVVFNQEGVRYFTAGQFEQALELFRRAVEADPANPEYRRHLALTLLRLGDAGAAAAQLEEVIGADPGRDLAYANLAEAQLAQGDTSAAIESLQRFLQVSANPGLRRIAERQIRELRAAQVTGGLLGEPVDTPVRLPDATRTPTPVPGDTTPRSPAGVP